MPPAPLGDPHSLDYPFALPSDGEFSQTHYCAESSVPPAPTESRLHGEVLEATPLLPTSLSTSLSMAADSRPHGEVLEVLPLLTSPSRAAQSPVDGPGERRGNFGRPHCWEAPLILAGSARSRKAFHSVSPEAHNQRNKKGGRVQLPVRLSHYDGCHAQRGKLPT